jgi:hypothetical protein
MWLAERYLLSDAPQINLEQPITPISRLPVPYLRTAGDSSEIELIDAPYEIRGQYQHT